MYVPDAWFGGIYLLHPIPPPDFVKKMHDFHPPVFLEDGSLPPPMEWTPLIFAVKSQIWWQQF